MYEALIARNRNWMKETFRAERESARWFVYHCLYCGWGWAATTTASHTALEGRLALHLVERHVDLGELLVD